jgi:hypothetical protein
MSKELNLDKIRAAVAKSQVNVSLPNSDVLALCDRMEAQDKEISRLQTIIDNRSEDKEVLAKYRDLQIANTILREALEEIRDATSP